MYLKYTVDGPLEDIVRKVWPDISEDEILRDYENVYEWVWLRLSQFGIFLNVSREHEWGEGINVFPIYVCAFDMQKKQRVEDIPESVR